MPPWTGRPNLALRARTAPKRHVQTEQHKSGDERQDEDLKHLLVQRTAPKRANRVTRREAFKIVPTATFRQHGCLG